jgi:hypothetical protein
VRIGDSCGFSGTASVREPECVFLACAGVVVAGGFYLRWAAWGYLNYCVACAAPYIVVPLLFPAKADKVMTAKEPSNHSSVCFILTSGSRGFNTGTALA